MRSIIKWTVCSSIIALTLAIALGGVLSSCSSKPTAWIGQGLSFDDAADKAMNERTRVSSSAPFGFYEGPMSFMYDDGGVQRKGWVTVYNFNGSHGWFVAPSQCASAPANYCARYGVNDFVIHDRTDEFMLLSAPTGSDCANWPTRCRLVGFRYDTTGEGCGWYGTLWCPVYECFNGCPPDKAGE